MKLPTLVLILSIPQLAAQNEVANTLGLDTIILSSHNDYEHHRHRLLQEQQSLSLDEQEYKPEEQEQEDKPIACTEDHELYIQAALSTDDYYGANAGVMCKCLSSSSSQSSSSSSGSEATNNNYVSCKIPRDIECTDYNCDSGWQCANANETYVSVCANVQDEELWKISSQTGWTRAMKIDTRYFSKGVSNVQSRSAVIDRTTDPASCGAFYVDGIRCNSCERCVKENDDGTSVFKVVANCTNVVEGAVATCDGGQFLKTLLVLDSNATGAPTVSPTPFPTRSPTMQPTMTSSASLQYSMFAAIGCNSMRVVFALFVLMIFW